MNEYTTDELHRALGAFLTCFGAGLPDTLRESIRTRAYAVAEQIERGGEPNVGTLTRSLADALNSVHRTPPSH